MKSPRPIARLGQLMMVIATILASAAPTASSADTLRQGTTTLVSVKPDGSPADGAEPSLSEDGRYVAFSSFDRLISEDTDSNSDVYRKDMITGQSVLVSVEIATYNGTHNFRPSISGDGTRVAYLSGWWLTCPGGVSLLRPNPCAWARTRTSGTSQHRLHTGSFQSHFIRCKCSTLKGRKVGDVNL